MTSPAKKQKPEWLRIRMPTGKARERYDCVKKLTTGLRIHTICVEAKCPDISECWGCGTATFLLMGDICTRYCRFCNTKSSSVGIPMSELVDEPENIAAAVGEMNLKYVVLTSVDRDDLPDQGSQHFADCVRAIRQRHPDVAIELLIPDFQGDENCLRRIVDAKPDVIGHNLETVQELHARVRDLRASYQQSLAVLAAIKKLSQKTLTKSALMLGLGENDEQIEKAMGDLRAVGCDILTLGQYLQPGSAQLPVEEYIKPEKFDYWREVGEKKGFLFVASGPFVRSSYKAGEFFIKHAKR